MIENQGVAPTATQQAAIHRGIETMGLEPRHVAVVFARDFDATVRQILASTTYSADRGTGTVAAKTIRTGSESVIVMNAATVDSMDDAGVERLAAHESGHVLLHNRDEYFGGPPYTEVSEWRYALAAMGALALEEFRIEKSLAVRGYPASPSCAPDHVATLLHWTNVDLINVSTDAASTDVRYLYNGVLAIADCLTKVLAYSVAFDADGGEPSGLVQEGKYAVEGWHDFVAPSWGSRCRAYRRLPSADHPLSRTKWRTAVAACAEVERSLVRSMGYEFRDSADGGWGFHARLGDAAWQAHVERALAQDAMYTDSDPLP
ncbi:hypothetical protein [Yimella sp. NH-Cas1]|uniref:hypothetical protein n=1 Tax=Yimella sp. NH-Cas1 TaxID=2917726 RepID=UPI001EFAA7C9|nr:hypothetical protein [Yimella sp. NH-Cas1]MCG8656766.1 hypothetical protein [Yimella sp. NH-Cas1]